MEDTSRTECQIGSLGASNPTVLGSSSEIGLDPDGKVGGLELLETLFNTHFLPLQMEGAWVVILKLAS